MKNLFMFFVLSVFAVSVNARNTISKTNTTTSSIGKACNVGYSKVNSKCVKLYCNDLPKTKKEVEKNNSFAKKKQTRNALDLSSFSEAISELNSAQQTKDILDSKDKCFKKIITKCNKDGFKISADNLSCEIKMCSTVSADSIDATRKKQELSYDKSKKCYEPKIDKCELGFELKENKCEKVLCETKPSIANSTKTTKDFLYEKKCFITELATECATGYELKNKDSDKTVCEKKEAKVCSSQPSLKNSTKTIDNFLYEAGNCIIEPLTRASLDLSRKGRGGDRVLRNRLYS